MAGAGYGTALAIQYARLAEEAGADGLLAMPPYLVVADQEGLHTDQTRAGRRRSRSAARAAGPETGVPTRDQALRSLRSFVATVPAAISGWAPPVSGAPAAAYAQQASPPPLLSPSITEAWTGTADGR